MYRVCYLCEAFANVWVGACHALRQAFNSRTILFSRIANAPHKIHGLGEVVIGRLIDDRLRGLCKNLSAEVVKLEKHIKNVCYDDSLSVVDRLSAIFPRLWLTRLDDRSRVEISAEGSESEMDV